MMADLSDVLVATKALRAAGWSLRASEGISSDGVEWICLGTGRAVTSICYNRMVLEAEYDPQAFKRERRHLARRGHRGRRGSGRVDIHVTFMDGLVSPVT